MAVSAINVTKNKLRRNHKDTIDQAVRDAQFGDTIVLYPRQVAVNGPYLPMDKGLYIGSANPQKPTTIRVNNHKVGFWLKSGDLHLSNVRIELTDHANGITALPNYQGRVYLKNVTITHVGKMRARDCYPCLSASNNGGLLNAEFHIENCTFDDLNLSSKVVNVSNSILGRLDGDNSLISAVSPQIVQSELSHIQIQNQSADAKAPGVIKNIKTTGCLSFVGNCLVAGIQFINGVKIGSHPFGFLGIGSNPKQVMRSYGIPERMPMLSAGSFQGLKNQITFSNISFGNDWDDLQPQDLSAYPYWFNFNNANVTIKATKIPLCLFGLKNITQLGDLRLDHVEDRSKWDVHKTEISENASNSNLFTHFSLTGLSTKPTNHALEKLDSLIGLKPVKKEIKTIIDNAEMNQHLKNIGKGAAAQKTSLHTIFMGDPGTGKTTVARLFAKALKEGHVISNDKLVECQGNDLMAGYVGQSKGKTRQWVHKALGGVLFIDEAYTLAPQPGNDNSFAKEAVAELVADMENYRDDLIVIMAGYTVPMQHFLNTANVGLISRFQNIVQFPDYSKKEMVEILQLMFGQADLQWRSPQDGQAIVQGLMGLVNNGVTGNGRLVRKYVDNLISAKNARIQGMVHSSGKPLSAFDDQALVVKASDAQQSYRHMMTVHKNSGQKI